jgi:hypothetical protein
MITSTTMTTEGTSGVNVMNPDARTGVPRLKYLMMISN